jgi:hypothetical protein
MLGSHAYYLLGSKHLLSFLTLDLDGLPEEKCILPW